MPFGFPAYAEKSVKYHGVARKELARAALDALDELSWNPLKDGKWCMRLGADGVLRDLFTWGAKFTVEVKEEKLFIRSEGLVPIEWFDVGQHGANIKVFLHRFEDILEEADRHNELARRNRPSRSCPMMEPKVRQMIVCEDVRTRPGSQGKLDVFGIMNKVAAKRFPLNLSFAVYLCLTDARGTGQGRIDVRKVVNEDYVYVGDLHEFEFGNDPLHLHPFMIRVFSCPLPGPGLYSVQFVYNDVALESYVLLVEKAT